MTRGFFPPADNPPPLPSLIRQLSIAYIFRGKPTNDDPRSYDLQERIERENVLLDKHPDTGYAKGILRDRQAAEAAPQPQAHFARY